jgi:hypothetical protein
VAGGPPLGANGSVARLQGPWRADKPAGVPERYAWPSQRACGWQGRWAQDRGAPAALSGWLTRS